MYDGRDALKLAKYDHAMSDQTYAYCFLTMHCKYEVFGGGVDSDNFSRDQIAGGIILAAACSRISRQEENAILALISLSIRLLVTFGETPSALDPECNRMSSTTLAYKKAN